MTWEHWIFAGAAAAALASLLGCVLLGGLVWLTRRKAARTAIPARVTEGGPTVPPSVSSTAPYVDSADLLLAAFRLVKAEGEADAARAFAGDLRSAEAGAARAMMGRTLSPKAEGPAGSA